MRWPIRWSWVGPRAARLVVVHTAVGGGRGICTETTFTAIAAQLLANGCQALYLTAPVALMRQMVQAG